MEGSGEGMRIDSIKQIDPVYKKCSKTNKVKGSIHSKSDCIEISGTGKELQIAKNAVKEADDIRWDKVNDIKQRMASGTYNVSCEEVAEKIVDGYFDKRI